MCTVATMDISVVIPVYNEEKCIEETLRRVGAFMSLKPWSWELIVSSDGSTDKTDEIVRAIIEKRGDGKVKLLAAGKNAGKGAVVRRGALEAQGKHILVTDADLSAPIKESDKLLAALEGGCDVAVGSRAMREKGCDVQQSFKRRLAGRIFNVLVRLLVLKDFQDTQCGFKCFKKEAARALFREQVLNGFSFDVEILFLAKKRGLKVKEVPVMWREAKSSKVKLFRDSLGMLKELMFLRKRYRIRIV